MSTQLFIISTPIVVEINVRTGNIPMQPASMMRFFESQSHYSKIVHNLIFCKRLTAFPTLVDQLLECAIFGPLIHHIEFFSEEVEGLHGFDEGRSELLQG